MGPAPDTPPLPDWAVEHARAALGLGLSVPEVEQRLVARGLPPVTAAAVVTSILETRVRRRFESLEQGEQRQRLHRLLSGFVGCVCLLLAYYFGGGMSAGKTLLWVLLPLACIWFPEEVAGYTGSASAALLRWCGWLVLLVIGGYRILLILVSG